MINEQKFFDKYLKTVTEEKGETYDDFFKRKLGEWKVSGVTDLSDEDKKKFFDEVDAEWTGEKE